MNVASWFHEHVVSLTTFLPLLTAVVVIALPSVRASRAVAMGGSLITMLCAAHIWYYFQPTADLQFVEAYEWLPSFGIRYVVGVDGINLLLILLTCFLTPCVLLSLWGSTLAHEKIFLALILSLECGMLGSLVAFDLVFFYVFWEIMLIPMYFMIGIWGGANRIYATTKFVLYTVFGSLLMLVAAISLYILHYNQFGVYSTSLLDIYRLKQLSVPSQNLLFLAFALAFAIKVPLWPFHTWLPHAHTEAPTSGSVLLAGVLLKMGTYGFLRFALPLFPDALATFSPLLMTLGIVGIIYGALVAWMQPDAKKLVAYSSVSHLGFVVVGSVAFLDNQLSIEALTGAVYQMINHGLSTGALFFLVGVIYERRHTRLLADFGGLAQVMPWFAILLIVATLGSVGLPGTGGFVGEFLILIGVFKFNPIASIFASLGVVLGAIYMLTLCRKILFGPITHKENERLRDLTAREKGYLLPISALIIFTGICPNVFLEKIRPSLTHLAEHVSDYQLNIMPGSGVLGVQAEKNNEKILKNQTRSSMVIARDGVAP